MKEPNVQVGILFEPQIEFVLQNHYQIWGTYGGGLVTYHTIVTGKQVVTYSEGKMQWNNYLFDALSFEPTDATTDSFELIDVTIGINFHWERKENQHFLGALKFVVENEKLTAINILSVEDYLTSVISSEMSATASLELLKAHAVISRSWLLGSLSPSPSPVGRGTDSSSFQKGDQKGERGGQKLPYQTADGFSYELLKEKKRALVHHATEAEQIMWKFLRGKQINVKFRRQHIIDNYIADFACLEKHLIIEIDGDYHFTPEQQEKDKERTHHLESLGYSILRFTNDQVIASPESILKTINAHIAQLPLPTEEGPGERLLWYERDSHTRFDVCADDHCQRYQGITRASTPAAAEAVRATRGQVLMFEGKICDARFSKCCGGISEEFQYCWEDMKHPYLIGKQDRPHDRSIVTTPPPYGGGGTGGEAFCNTTDKKILAQVLNNYDQETTDFYRWKVEYTQQELSELIKNRSGIDYGQIIDLIPVARGTSGRLWKLQIVGTKRTLTIGKELEIRRTLSTSHLYSSAFEIDKTDISEGIPGRFILTGAGWGHGVGLCQIGAAVMGEQGYLYDAILMHYYSGATIEKRY